MSPDARRRKQRPRAKRRRRPGWPVWLAAGGVLALSAGLLLTALLRSDPEDPASGSGATPSRMEPYASLAGEVRLDLLYLTYLDSLARHGRAVPPGGAAANGLRLVHRVVAAAGIDTATVREWGLLPPPEPGHGELNVLFREMYRRGRVALPADGASLWTHVREREVHPGYLVFGRTATAASDQIDFCGILTAVNWLQPEYSMVLYHDPRSGRTVHGSVKEMPTISYYGGGRPGSDLADVYQEHIRLAGQWGRKPLYPGP